MIDLFTEISYGYILKDLNNVMKSHRFKAKLGARKASGSPFTNMDFSTLIPEWVCSYIHNKM